MVNNYSDSVVLPQVLFPLLAVGQDDSSREPTHSCKVLEKAFSKLSGIQSMNQVCHIPAMMMLSMADKKSTTGLCVT